MDSKNRNWLCMIGVHTYESEKFLAGFRRLELKVCHKCGKTKFTLAKTSKEQKEKIKNGPFI